MSLITFEMYGVTEGTQEVVHWSLTCCILWQRLSKQWQCCVVARAISFCDSKPTAYLMTVVAALAVSACSASSRQQMVEWCKISCCQFSTHPPSLPS